MQRLPTKMQRRPPTPHQATLARITADGRAGRELIALDAHAKHRGWPARLPDETAHAYAKRLRRDGIQGDSTP
jgi:hypothetical protein